MTNVKILSLYEKIMENLIENPMYSTSLEDEQLVAHKFSNGRVTDKLTERDVDNMVSGERKVFFLDAPPGAGKTTLIFEGPLKKLRERGKKICYLVPRVSLAVSIKEQLSKNDKGAEEIRKRLNEYGIQKQIDFGVMDILTYQSIFQLSEKDAEEYGLIVFDEIHYFIEDANFNRETEKQLDFMLNKFQRVNKIFISATMQDIFDSIYRKCRDIENSSFYKRRWYELYYFERDYRYIIPRFFSDIEELILRIVNSNNKWLIFVDSIEKGNQLVDIFNSKDKELASFFDAKAKMDERSENVFNMITDETFSTKIGILTNAYDVGINIRDKNLSVIMFSYTKTQFIQELGRKRVNGKERVEVFINVPNKKKIRNRMVQIQQELKRIYDDREFYNENFKFNGYCLQHPFYCVDGRVQMNRYTITKLRNDYQSYRAIIDVPEDVYEKTYKSMILQWLEWSTEDIEEYLVQNNSTDDIKLQIAGLIEKVNYQIPIEEFDIFVQKLLKIRDLRSDKRPDRKGSIQAVNKVLSLISYKARKTTDGFYVIEPIEIGG